MYQNFYQKFLNAHKDKIHLAAHSHHFWPDISLEGQIQAWEDAALYSDQKWDKILGVQLPKAQKHMARMINFSHPENIAIAPNTHELLSRLLSCFIQKDKFKVLTTKSEFHSFRRQINRLKELPQVKVVIIDNEQDNFETHFLDELTKDIDLIFVSHVFFNSGLVLQDSFIEKVIQNKSKETLFCLDGYHAFCAIEVDIKKYENDLFYLGGGYKYAQAGEGLCFMTLPKQTQLRPVNTGWFASFQDLSNTSDEVNYSDDGFRFWGATQDLSSLYRFNKVWDQFEKNQISLNKIHSYIQSLQQDFIENIKFSDQLISTDLKKLGHFLTLKCKDTQHAHDLHQELLKAQVITDFRQDRLRFGFGLYLTKEDIMKASKIINNLYLGK